VKHGLTIFRVERHVAGGTFPFDKIYFFKREAVKLLPRVFPHAFVIFPNKPFVKMIEEAITCCKIGKVYPMARSDEEKLKKMVSAQNPIQDVIFNYKKYVGVVPILFLQDRNKKMRVKPAYLHADSKARPGRYCRHYGIKSKARDNALENMQRMMRDAVTGRSYFLSDGKEFRPVCSICTNSLAMITGQCHLGNQACFENLAQTKPSDYRKNMLRYNSWIKELNEPEVALEVPNE
jgi:hypothetical protein